MRVMFVGDLNVGEHYTSFGHGPKSYMSSKNVFEKVQPIFDQADFVVGNLESVITNYELDLQNPESVVFRGSYSAAPAQLRNSGFKILQVANNHTVHHGKVGFSDTCGVLKQNGIEPVGLLDEEFVIINHDGQSMGFLAASDVPDNMDKNQAQYEVLSDQWLARVSSAVGQVDYLVVMLHWGLEASTEPLPYQRKLAEKLRRLGVTAIIGSHPHVFYEVEKTNEFIAAYSLGNFVFDVCWDERLKKSGILDLEFGKSGVVGRIWPIELKENGCLPTPSGDAVPLTKTVTLYDLGRKMDKQLIRKNIHFVKNIFKGNVGLKCKFYFSKVSKLFKNDI